MLKISECMLLSCHGVTYKFQSESTVYSIPECQKTALWLNGWLFVYELSTCGFESCCSSECIIYQAGASKVSKKKLMLWKFPWLFYTFLKTKKEIQEHTRDTYVFFDLQILILNCFFLFSKRIFSIRQKYICLKVFTQFAKNAFIFIAFLNSLRILRNERLCSIRHKFHRLKRFAIFVIKVKIRI